MRAAVAIGLALTLASGCSLIYMDRIPDDQPASATPRCTTTRGYAATDLFWGVYYGAAVAAAVDSDTSGEADTAAGVFAAAVAVLHLYSAWQGFDRVDRCRKARAAHDAWLQRRTADY